MGHFLKMSLYVANAMWRGGKEKYSEFARAVNRPQRIIAWENTKTVQYINLGGWIMREKMREYIRFLEYEEKSRATREQYKMCISDRK